MSRHGIRSILLIQLGDTGDVVLSFPCIRALRESFPEAQVVVAVREKAKELIEDCPWASGVISIDKKRRGLLKGLRYHTGFFLRLRKYDFDLVLDLRTGTRGAILALLSGAAQRLGFYSEDGGIWRNRVFTRLYSRTYDPKEHVTQYYLSLPFFYGIRTEHQRPEIPVSIKNQREARELLRSEGIDEPFVLLQPFSLWQYKEWTLGRYIELVRWIRSRYDMPVLVIGSADERERAEQIIRPCGQGSHNFAGKTRLGVLPALIQASRLLIGVDSAGNHLAGAVGTPTVSIFGPSSPISWAPMGEANRVVQKAFPCVPCRQKGCDGTEVSRCLQELTLDEVRPAIEGLLDREKAEALAGSHG